MPKNIVLFDKARTRLICSAQFLLRHLFLNVNIANYWQFLLLLINKDRTSNSVSSRFESVQNDHLITERAHLAPATVCTLYVLNFPLVLISLYALNHWSLLMSLMLKRTMTIQFPKRKKILIVLICVWMWRSLCINNSNTAVLRHVDVTYPYFSTACTTT